MAKDDGAGVWNVEAVYDTIYYGVDSHVAGVGAVPSWRSAATRSNSSNEHTQRTSTYSLQTASHLSNPFELYSMTKLLLAAAAALLISSPALAQEQHNRRIPHRPDRPVRIVVSGYR